MIKRALILTITIAIATFTYFNYQKLQTKPVQAQGSLTLTVNPSQRRTPFSQEMLGVQTPQWMFIRAWNKPYIDSVPGLGAAYNEAGIKLIRYGGGLESNDVGWERSIQKPRQDSNYQAIDWRPNRANYSSQFASQINTSNTYQMHYGMDEIDALGRFTRQTGINVMLQINIEENDPAMWADLLHYANVEKGYNFKYFEIGNEFDLEVWEQKSNVTPQIYQQRLEAYLEALKKVDPDIKIISGVPAGAHNGYINGWLKRPEFSDYLTVAAQATSPSGYKSDALSYHWYSACRYFQTHTPQTIALFENPEPDNFITYSKARQWAAVAPSGINSQIINRYLPGALLGITENNYDYCDFFTTSFNSNHLDTLRQIDTLGRLAYNGLDYNIWYTGFGDSYETYPIIYPESLNPPITGYQLRSSYYGLYMYGNYFGNQMVQSSSSNEANLSIWASTSPDNSLKLMITNLTSSPITAPINITGTTINSAQAYQLSNPNPTDTSDRSKSGNHGTTINGTTLNYATIASAQITPRSLTNISGSTLTHTFPAYSATAIQINADGVDAPPIPTPTPDPDTPTCSYPADILNLQSWKQTLPIGPAESPTEIRQPQLATYVNNPYFQPTADCSGVIFRAHTSGTTTSGSGYPRSELRQMIPDGSNEIAWSRTSGQNSMYIDQAITRLPNGKQHIVAGQIHDADDDVIVVRLEGTKLFIDHNGQDGPTLTDNYQLGTRFNVKFESLGDGKINMYYNGNLIESYTPPGSTGGYYFKAGAYTQSNCSTESQRGQTCGITNYGEVEIYDLVLNNQSTPQPTPTTTIPVPPTTNQGIGPATVGDKKHLVDKNGNPYLIIADTGFEMYKWLTREDIDRYFKTRSEQGYTSILVSISPPYHGVGSPNVYGDRPFDSPQNLNPNEAFWEHVDYSLDKAEEYGLSLGIFPMWGWQQEQSWFNAGNLRPYGQWLGNRYKDRDNLFYVLGGDRVVTKRDAWNALAQGLDTGSGNKHLITFHPRGGYASYDELSDNSFVDFHMNQSGHTRDVADRDHPSYTMIKDTYQNSSKPVIDGESRYENIWIGLARGNPTFTAYDIRKSAYWSFLAGGIGHTYGTMAIQVFHGPGQTVRFDDDTPWEQALNRPGGRQVGLMSQMLQTLPWHTLLPDESFVSGGGVGSNRIAAAHSDSVGMVYLPNGGNVTVDLSKLTANTQTYAKWFNPSNAQYTDLTGPFSGNHTFSATIGDPDAVLILQPQNLPTPQPNQPNPDGPGMCLPDIELPDCTVNVSSGQNIQSAINSASAGDTICIAPGEYYQEIEFRNKSGNANNRITLRAQDLNNPPTITGRAGRNSGNTGLPACASGCNAGDLQAIDPRSGKGYKWDGLVRIQNSQYITIYGLNLTDSMGFGYFVQESSNIIVSNSDVSWSRGPGLAFMGNRDNTNLPTRPNHDNLFQNSRVHRNNNRATYSRSSSVLNWPPIVTSSGGYKNTFKNVEIFNNWGEGLTLDDFATAIGNTVYDNYALQIYVNARRSPTISNNFVYCTKNSGFYRGNGPSAGIALNNEQDRGATSTSGNVTITNNIVVGCGPNLGLWSQNQIGIQGMNISNNTFVNSFNGTGENNPAININRATTNLFSGDFANNIIYQTEPGRLIAISGNHDLDFKNNIWYDGNNNQPIASARGSNDQYTNPQLVSTNVTNDPNNYKLQSGSPAIDKGTTNNLTVDKFFGERPVGSAIDIGAHEFGSTSNEIPACLPPTDNPTPDPNTPSPTPNPDDPGMCTTDIELSDCTINVSLGQNIQNAINSASSNDTICIAPGTYNQTFNINKAGLTVRAQDLSNPPTIDGNHRIPAGNGGTKNGKAYTFGGLVDISNQDITLSHINITKSLGRGLRIYSPSNPVTNTHINQVNISYSRNAGLIVIGPNINLPGTDTDGTIIQNSIVEENVLVNFPNGHGGSGFILAGANNVLIKNNIIRYNYGEGLIVDSNRGNSSNVDVIGNIIQDNRAATFYIHGAKEMNITHNLIYQSTPPKVGDNPVFGCLWIQGLENESAGFLKRDGFPIHGVSDLLIQNNTMIGCQHSVIMSAQAPESYVRDVEISYNTFINLGHQNKFARDKKYADFYVPLGARNLSNISYSNNIFAHEMGNNNQVNLAFRGAPPGSTFNNNLWTDKPAYPEFANDRQGNVNFANTFEIPTNDPPTAEDYARVRNMFLLQEGSPAINAGAGAAPTNDYYFGARDAQADIGAHEYGSTPGETPWCLPDPNPTQTPTPEPSPIPSRVPTNTPPATPTPDPVNAQCNAACQPSHDLGFCSNYCNDNSPRFDTGPAGLCAPTDRQVCCCQYLVGGASGPIPVTTNAPTPTPPNTQQINFATAPRICQLSNVIQNILSIALALSGIAAFIMFIIGGYLWLTAGTNQQQIDLAKQTLTWAIAGIALTIGAIFILLIIESFTGIPLTQFEIPWIGDTSLRPSVCP